MYYDCNFTLSISLINQVLRKECAKHEGGFCGGWGPWPAGVRHGSGLSRLVSTHRSPFGRGAAAEGATMTVTFGGERGVR